MPAWAGKYDDGTPIAVIGVIHEFGAPERHIPERSFLRVPLRQKSKEIAKAFRVLSAAVIRNEITVTSMLDQVGARAVAYCQDAIADGINPPNKESTVRRKGSATPLIDKGDLRGSIIHVIEDK